MGKKKKIPGEGSSVSTGLWRPYTVRLDVKNTILSSYWQPMDHCPFCRFKRKPALGYPVQTRTARSHPFWIYREVSVHQFCCWWNTDSQGISLGWARLIFCCRSPSLPSGPLPDPARSVALGPRETVRHIRTIQFNVRRNRNTNFSELVSYISDPIGDTKYSEAATSS